MGKDPSASNPIEYGLQAHSVSCPVNTALMLFVIAAKLSRTIARNCSLLGIGEQLHLHGFSWDTSRENPLC